MPAMSQNRTATSSLCLGSMLSLRFWSLEQPSQRMNADNHVLEVVIRVWSENSNDRKPSAQAG